MPLSEGDLAPDFDLPASGGGRVGLSALKGHKVVLYFYPKYGIKNKVLKSLRNMGSVPHPAIRCGSSRAVATGLAGHLRAVGRAGVDRTFS